MVVRLRTQVDQRAQLRPGKVHQVGVAPSPLHPFPGPPRPDILFKLKHAFANVFRKLNRPVSATPASLCHIIRSQPETLVHSSGSTSAISTRIFNAGSLD